VHVDSFSRSLKAARYAANVRTLKPSGVLKRATSLSPEGARFSVRGV
jgi:hypothetical protein